MIRSPTRQDVPKGTVADLDREQFAGGVPKKQTSRVRSLHKAGAKVYLCSESGQHGSYHCKALVIDRRVLLAGSANLTNKSRSNRELVFRITGLPVVEVLQDLARDRTRGRLWDGK